MSDPLPVLSWCGSNKSADIIFPTWDQTKNTRQALYRITADITYVASRAGEAPKWEEKWEKALFRGRDSNRARLTLAELSHKDKSGRLDAGITNYNFRGIDEDKWGPKADYVALQDMAKWKYNLLIDGTVAAYRAPYLFQLGSLILKQNSDFYEWWYGDIEDGKHYVEIKVSPYF